MNHGPTGRLSPSSPDTDRGERLRSGESRLRGVLDGMAEGFALLAPDFTILDLNQEALRQDGRPRDAIVGRTHWDAYPGSQESELGRRYQQAMADRIPVTLEHRYSWPGGREAWLEMRAYPIDEGLAVFYRDVSQRHEADAALRASESRLSLSEESLRLSTEAAEVGTWDLDVPHDVLTWSDRTRAMFGISPETPTSMAAFYAGLHPDDREMTTAAFASALDPAVRSTYDVEYRTVGGTDGVVRWVAAKGKGLFDADGRCIRAIGTAIDITARKRLQARQAALVELGDRIRDLADPAQLAFAAAEILGRTLGVSRAGYGTIDKARESITIERDWNAPGVESLAGVLQFRDYGSYIEDLKAGRTVAIHDAFADPRTASTAKALVAISARAFVNMPVTENGGFVALLYLNHAGEREWPEDELDFVREVAARTRTATARLTAEQELRASEARLRAVLDAVPVGLIFADAPSGEITGGNAQAERIFSHPILPSPDVEHYRDWVSYHPDGRRVEGPEYPLSRAISGEAERPELEVLYRRGDGRDAFIRLIASPVRGEGNRITGGVVASLDIDREKRAEANLRALNETLERQVQARTAELDRVWQNSRDLLVVIGADGIFRAVNPAWTAILGHEPSEVVGHSFLEFIWPEDAALTQGGLDDAAAARDLTSFENRYRHKDGSPRAISWHTSAERDLVYAYGRDITAEKDQAEALAQAQEALRQSQKMEAVGQLTGGIAHDFNNMLAVVIGSLDLLGRRMGTADARSRRYVEAASEGAKRAALLTQRLLAFSRQQPLKPESVDANRLVADISELIRGSVGRDIKLETVLASGLWRAHADPNQLENVLLNLAVNARDAMPEGGSLTIETQNAHLDARYVAAYLGVAAGQYVLIAVTDTGTGMPQEVVAKAFDPFFTTKEVGKGTGLGLSQVYGFVKQSGGHVKIYSEAGQGTTIKVYLPRMLGAEHDTTAETISPELLNGDLQEVILVVEDEPAVRQLSVDALTELGYRVLEADGAAAALRQIDAHPEIGLLFTDIVMPDVNGAKLAQEVRRRRPQLRVLFTTGYTRNAVVHNGVLDRGVELIGKPFTIEELAAKVREVLDKP